MSAPRAPRGPLFRLAQALALGLTFALVLGARRAVPHAEETPATLVSLGFLLLTGMLTSELLDLIGLPHLTGYLLAGVVAGPHGLHLVEHAAVERLQGINTLALALIALAGGLELKLSLLRAAARSVAWATLVQSTLGIVAGAGAFLIAARHLPFVAELGARPLAGVALLWGVLTISRSPSATLGILAQLRPEGPVSRFALAFVMSSDIVVAVLLTLALAVTRPLIDPAGTLSLRDLQELGHELVGSVSLGTTIGLTLALYLWLAGGQLLVVLVGLGFGLSAGLRYLHFDPLLTFMVAGFVVENGSDQGGKLLAAIERASSVVFVVFFAIAGAHLDLPLLGQLWPVALFLCGARALSAFGAHRLGARLADDLPVVRRWGFAPLVSQAGLSLAMAMVVERTFPTVGVGFRALAVATVAVNELVGPVLFKIAVDRAGEVGRAAMDGGGHAAEAPS